MTVTVSPVTEGDIDALVVSVAGLFAEDAGRHDPTMDLRWPEREGAPYYSRLLGDQTCLLVRHFFTWARHGGARQASVTAYAANDAALRFYARHGFSAKSVTSRAVL